MADIQFQFVKTPEPVGFWLISPAPNHTQFPVYKKPNRFHRFMTTLLLGWKWQPIPINQED